MIEVEQKLNGHAHETPPSLAHLPRILFLVRDRDFSCALMPETVRRVKRFCVAIDSDDDPDILEDILWGNFASKDPQMVAQVAVDSNGDVIGHVLANIEDWGKKKLLIIRQYAIDDDAKIPVDLIRAAMQEMEEWGRMHGAVKMRVLALTDAWERGLRTFYGFKKKRVILERNL